MKTYSIENNHLKVKVREKGAELSSLFNKDTGREHIWKADPEIWGSSAPNLFPIIGALKDGSFKYKGESFKMPKHGIIRNNENIRLKEKTPNQLVFELTYSKESLQNYPFRFNFQIAFTLRDNHLEVSHHIINLDEKEIYFSLGGHPAFNIQYLENEKIEDYYIEFDQKLDLKTHLLNSEGLVSSKTEMILNDQKKLKLSESIFNNDALIFKDISSKKASLVSKDLGKILSISYTEFENLGIWAKPGAPYVCIEPWLGIADAEDSKGDFSAKEGMIKLSPAKQFNASYYIEIH